MKNRIFSVLAMLALVLGTLSAEPKYIFFFIGDGMGMGHVMSAQTYNRTVLKNEKPLVMMQFPVASQAMTYSATGPVTDSAAAGTALSTGNKTLNGMLGMLPDSTHVTSIAKYLQDRGYGIGITTSVPLDDATPGAFYAHVPYRKHFDNIIKDMANSDYEFFAGGHVHASKADATKALTDAGYKVAYGLDEYAKLGDARKKVLFPTEGDGAAQVGYTIDSIPGALTLPQITKAAIDHMYKVSPEKFFLMVEGGNIDWAAHSNDGGAVVKEVLNFDQSLKMAYDFYLEHPYETLIVVTADHDTGGMTVGVRRGPKVVDFSNIDYQRSSKDVFSDWCRTFIKGDKKITWKEMRAKLVEKYGLFTDIQVDKRVEKEIEKEFNEVFIKHKNKENQTLYNVFNGFVEIIYRTLDRKNGFGWTTNGHTGNPVPVYAIGEGSELFRSINNNIEIPAKMAQAVGFELNK